MTYEESALLMTDMVFKGRVKVACLKYADSILVEATSVPAHNSRARWAQGCFQQPDAVAGTVQPPTVMDAAVQTAGAEIADDALQASVETVVNKML
jgi:hypothetical protein